MDQIYRATVNSTRGLAYAAQSEAALRKELAALFCAIALAPVVRPGIVWIAAMVGVLIFVITIELLNTAIEKRADHVPPQRHPVIGIIKDIGSAAVLCALGLAGLVWTSAMIVRFGLA